MASYKLEFKPSLHKDFKNLPKGIRQNAIDKIETLAEDPLPESVVKLSFSDNLYRVRIGEYRIIFDIDHKLRVVTIHHVRHRKEAYRNV